MQKKICDTSPHGRVFSVQSQTLATVNSMQAFNINLSTIRGTSQAQGSKPILPKKSEVDEEAISCQQSELLQLHFIFDFLTLILPPVFGFAELHYFSLRGINAQPPFFFLKCKTQFFR